MSAARPPLAVSAWGGTAALPSLDPASLYVLSLVQLAQVPAYAVEPSAWFHTDAVPSLYMAVTTQGHTYVGDVLATTPAAARAYLKEYLHEPHKAEIHAVLALLDDALNDLVLHTLFSLPPNFQKVTCPAFAGHASRWPSSLPRRLRAAVRARLESPHVALWGLGGSWEREERAQQARWHTQAGLQEARDPVAQLPRVGFRGNPGLAQDMRESWERSRLAARARQVLRAIQAHVPEQGFVAGCSQPSAADARLYSLLAPLVLETWPVDVLPALLASEFPVLVQHTHRMQEYLWQGTRGWAWAREASMTPPTSTRWTWPTWPTWPTWRSEAPKDARPLPPTLRWDRMLWIASAIIGPVVYLLASGLVVIEFDDEEAEEDEEEVEADEEIDADADDDDDDEDEAHDEADQLDANDIEELALDEESLEDDDM